MNISKLFISPFLQVRSILLHILLYEKNMPQGGEQPFTEPGSREDAWGTFSPGEENGAERRGELGARALAAARDGCGELARFSLGLGRCESDGLSLRKLPPAPWTRFRERLSSQCASCCVSCLWRAEGGAVTR